MSRKLIVNDGKRERELLLVGTMVVGRDPACDISEADPLLSRRHAEFVAGAREVVVRDLGSRNGILINGVKMTQGILKGGDVLQIGHLQVTFVEDSAAFVPPPDLDLGADATAMAVPPAPRAAAAPPSVIADSPTVAIPARAAEAPTVHTAVGPPPAPAGVAEDFDKTIPTARKPEAEDPDKTRFAAPPVTAKPPESAKPPVAAKPSESAKAPASAKSSESAKPSVAPRAPEPAKRPEAAKAPEPAKPLASPTPPPATSPAAEGEDPDKTRFVAPPAPKPAATPKAAPSVIPSAAAASVEDPDETRFVPPPAPKPAATPKAAPVATAPAQKTIEKPAAPPQAVAASSAPEQPPKAAEHATARVARRPWTFFILVQVALLAAVVFLATAIPLILWQSRVLNATASSRASALINWLAADARAALEGNRPGAIATASDEVRREPGVVGALILAPDGRVLSPASRSAETINQLPALGVKPGDISRLQQAWNGELVESARPVQAGERPRAAIAWITYRPSAPEEAGSGAVVLAVPVIIVLVAAWFTSRLINRQTMNALTLLNEDIELAVGGRLDAIGDPLGAKPVKDLADAVNYLIAKQRTTSSEASTRPAVASAKATTPRTVGTETPSAPAQPGAAAVKLSARIVTNAQYRVTEASPGCAYLIGVRPDALVGQHLINAIPDQDIADAVLQAFGALGASGEHRASVEPGARGYRVSIVVSREGKEKPLTIELSADREAEA